MDDGRTLNMIYHDPITKREIPVKSVYVPTKTLLQGKVYERGPVVLNKKQGDIGNGR